MKKLKRIFSCLCLVAVMALTILPGKTVYADGTGPQGTSNSTTPKPPPPPPSSAELWAILIWLINLLFG
jgi:hypothetical protein